MASIISSSFAKPNGVPAALIYMPAINGSFFAFLPACHTSSKLAAVL